MAIRLVEQVAGAAMVGAEVLAACSAAMCIVTVQTADMVPTAATVRTADLRATGVVVMVPTMTAMKPSMKVVPNLAIPKPMKFVEKNMRPLPQLLLMTTTHIPTARERGPRKIRFLQRRPMHRLRLPTTQGMMLALKATRIRTTTHQTQALTRALAKKPAPASLLRNFRQRIGEARILLLLNFHIWIEHSK